MKTDKLILKQIVILCLLFLTCSVLATAKSKNDNSPKPALSSSPTNGEIDSLYLLSFSFYSKTPEIARTNSLEIIKKSKRIGYTKGESNGNNLLGIIAKSVEGDYEKAILFYKKALLLRLKSDTDKNIASVHNNIGRCLDQQGKTDEAIASYTKGIEQMGSDSLSSMCSILYINLSDLYTKKEKYQQSIACLDKSFLITKKTKVSTAHANYYRSKAHLYKKLNNYDGAEKLYLKTLSISDSLGNVTGAFDACMGLGNTYNLKKTPDKALFYYEKANAYQLPTNSYSDANLDSNLGALYKSKKKYELSIKHYNAAIKAFTEQKLNSRVAKAQTYLGEIYTELENTPKAEYHFLEALKSLDDQSTPLLRNTIYNRLVHFYDSAGKTDLALSYSKKYIAAQDSIAIDLIFASNTQANLEEKEKENAELKTQVLAQDKKELWNRGLMALSFLFSLLVGAGFFAYRNRQQRLVAEYEADQAYLQIDDILKQQELNLAYAKLETKDEMQKQIGQDLHDRLGVMLSTIKLYFGEFVEELKDLNLNASQHQHKTIELLDEAVVEVRRIAHNMQSGVLKNFGLLDAVQDLAETIDQTNKLKVTVNAFGMKNRIPNDLEGKTFKIIQELVGNVLKHAKATKLGISLYKKDNLLNIIVEDNGVGFQLSEISDKGGMGLKNITFRVTELNGKCHFDSNAKTGTSVIIDIPIEADVI